MAKKEKVRLNVDWDNLFPGSTLKIGEQNIIIPPLGLRQLAKVAQQLKGFGTILVEEDINFDNFKEPEKFISLAAILLEQFPDVLSDVSNIHVDDLQEMPLEIIVELLDKVFEVNIESREALEKNFNSLAEKFQKAMPTQLEK